MRLQLVAALGLIVWLGACSDSPSGVSTPPPPTGLIASDPVRTTVGGSAGGAAQSLVAGDSTVYVSLFPGTAPGGSHATVRVVGSLNSVSTSVFDGGFDPVPMVAGLGDSIEVVVTDAGGAVVRALGVAVKAIRPPVVVRTEPPPRKRDVPLNAVIVVVFSEPVAGNSLTNSSVQVFRGSSRIAGSVSLLQGTGSAAAFTPDAALRPNTDYLLVVTRDVKDLEGDALGAEVAVPFTTGQSSTGLPASLTLSPDSVFMTPGVTYQMTATVRDAAGNQLIDLPIAWSTNDPNGLTVSQNGLLTALAPGGYWLSANVGSLQASAPVLVSRGPPASVAVSPVLDTVGAAGDTIILAATVHDSLGYQSSFPVTWTSSTPAVATVASYDAGSPGAVFGIVTGVSPGTVTITATSGTASGTASVTVIPPLPVASLAVTPDSAKLALGAAKQLSAIIRDPNGHILAGRVVSWTTDNGGAATVDASGLVTGVGAGMANVVATSERVSDTVPITVTQVVFTSVSAGIGYPHACGLANDGTAYCWGSNEYGQLGDGLTNDNPNPFPTGVVGGLTFAVVSSGFNHTCGITTTGAAYCWDVVPTAVSGGITFSSLSAGWDHDCGLTSDGVLYCWGGNASGQIGDGTTVDRPGPVAVGGALRFSTVSAGWYTTCALTTNGEAYCWGFGLGAGSARGSLMPAPLTGGLTFVSLSTGIDHSCAVTAAGVAYCWGGGGYGELGDSSGSGSNDGSIGPVAVSGGLRFSRVSAGSWYTCGITTGGAAYCWGEGIVYPGPGWASFPVAVGGGLAFTTVSTGRYVTCGLATTGTAYCWGGNEYGQLGDGTTTDSDIPVKVAGQP